MNAPGTIILHLEYGAPDCCGCLIGVVNGDCASVVCNECGQVVRRVPASDLQRTLNEMELELDLAMAVCPHCKSVNLLPGVKKQMQVFLCQRCEWLVDPSTE
jgi:hypothetical protein